jgi:glycosyltransferase involved in cell wall biosynthesis
MAHLLAHDRLIWREDSLALRLVAYTDNVERGGADLSMSHVLARLDPAVEVTVLGISRPIVEWVASARPSAAMRIVPRPRSDHDWRSLRAHLRAFREIGPDIVHANLSSPWSCQYAIAAAGLLRRPRTVAVYQLVVPPVSERQRLAKRLTARAVTRHVGVGERTSREVEELVRLQPYSVSTIHNGVPDEPPPSRPPALSPGTPPFIGAVGRIEFQKGFDTLIQALRQIPNATLVVVGDGSERRRLEDLARDLDVADRVAWTGWREDPRTYLPSFDVVALPSRFEGFPLALLEALLARSAVVAADVGSVAEAVRDGETGLLVPPEDPAGLAAAIRRLLADVELRRRLGENGRRLVLDRFTADRMTLSFESLYRELLR